MTSRPRRHTVATLIVAVAIGLPCAAWFVAGSRSARQEAERIEQGPILEGQFTSERIAQRLAVRLEALRHSETRRAFTDYGAQGRVFSAACDCAVQLPSPLAEGPTDPLIWAHFQIDEVGQLTLPTFAPPGPQDAARERAREALSTERAIFEVLECTGSEHLAARPVPRREDAPGSGVPAELEGIAVGALAWHTVELEGEPALVALREVTTPAAVLTQGFAIRKQDLNDLAADPGTAVVVRPGDPVDAAETRIPFDGSPWTVHVDVSLARQEARAAADGVIASFYRSFLVGMAAALLGAGLIVGMVWQSDRLARQRARFAASAAHELRTPLAGLRMYGEMLADGSGDPSHRELYGRRVAGEAERLGRVVSNLLGFARLERGDLRVRLVEGDLAEAVRNSVEQQRPTLEANGARLEVAVDSSGPVRFDRDAVHQILQNLLDNADKFSRSASDRTIRVELSRTEGGSRLSVCDRGPGVEPSVRRRLFEAFVRHPSPDAPDGLGLGLTLVQALARAQDAAVDYAEDDQGGSRFSVTFPAAA